MVKNSDVAWSFVSKMAAKGNNFFTDGKVIYSYGEHFPIAAHMRDGSVLFNSQRFSATTAKHQYLVRSALGVRLLPVVEVTCAELKKAIDCDLSGGVMVLHRSVIPSSDDELSSLLIKYYQKQGVGRRAYTRSKKFISEMRSLSLLGNL